MTDPVDRSDNMARVIDLDAFRKFRVIQEPESLEESQHVDEALELGNSGTAKPAVHGPVRKGLVKPKRDNE